MREGGLGMSLTRDTLIHIEGTRMKDLFEWAMGQVPVKGWKR